MSLFRFAPAVIGALALLGGACAGADDDAAVATNDAPAEAAAAGEDDLADVVSYELTMDGVDRLMAAQLAMGRAMQGLTPAERAAIEGDRRDEWPSLDEMEDRLSSNPAVEAAIREAGLSPREYGIIMYSMLQAGIVEARMAGEPNADQDSMASAVGVNPATVAFIRDNADELSRRRQELEAQMEALELRTEETNASE
jgi:hypothetical protein